MRRSKAKTNLGVRVEVEMVERIAKVAEREDVPSSIIVRKAIKKYLEEAEKQND